ncbi:FUSC family protein [Vallicoccus soli]|uniref:Integral membrane bound transporter domain-containing protein n=1 Tax=Vallicoccus soli TaxID=2339232 RepID=A0A3A3ZCQ5_9ACTN|nr:FUSC family protein [Vallicoccus soli]RJK92754.1 hypothetical protein D5H78_17940 [Vallicoccus soli]
MPPGPAPAARRGGAVLRGRAAAGTDRARTAVWPALQGAVGAALAYGLAQQLLGHPYPFFAGVAAFVCLGLTDERRLRRVAELAAGVTLGVLVGDAFVLTFGSGPVQLAVVLSTTVLVAVLLDGGNLVVTQAGVQSLLVVGLPPTAGSPFARWQDAFVGGAVALLVAVLLPADPRRLVRRRLRALLDELAAVLGLVADALRRADAAAAEAALERSRATQPLVDAAQAAVRGGREVTRLAPRRRRHRAEVARLAVLAGHADLAVRNARVLARRAVSAAEDGRPRPEVAAAVADLADAVRVMAAVDVPRPAGWATRPRLERTAARLGAGGPWREDLAGTALVLLVRPLVVDLLEATGLDHETARRALPRT